MPGDEVAVVVDAKGRFGKPEGRVERILRKGRKVLVGIYRERSGAPFLQPFDSLSQDDLPLKSRGKLRPEPGMIVEADRAHPGPHPRLRSARGPGRRRPGGHRALRAQVRVPRGRRARGRSLPVRGPGPRPSPGGGTSATGPPSPSTARRPRTSTTPSASGSSPAGGWLPRRPHRRRLALRAARQPARPRGRGAGDERLFSRPDPAHAARKALQRALQPAAPRAAPGRVRPDGRRPGTAA